MTTTKRKKIKLSALVLRLSFVSVALYLIAALISAQVELVAKRRELDSVTAQAQTQQAANLELQRVLATDDEDAYIERIAREKLGYARPDERVFVDMSGK